MNLDYLGRELIKENLLKDIIYLEETESTNLYAKKNNISNNILIITDYQTNGRGRFNRNWISDKSQNILITLVSYFSIPKTELFLINYFASVTILKALEKIISFPLNSGIKLKWPNDIIFNRKKICGILSESNYIKNFVTKVIIGIGLNINQTEFPDELVDKATSVKNETGKEFERELIIKNIIELFYRNLNDVNHKKELIEEWKSKTDILDKPILFKKNEKSDVIKGNVINLDYDGGIIIEIENGMRNKYFNGDVSLIY